jgi:hypothetical protein
VDEAGAARTAVKPVAYAATLAAVREMAAKQRAAYFSGCRGYLELLAV